MSNNQFFTEFPVSQKLDRKLLGQYFIRWVSGIEASQLDIPLARKNVEAGQPFVVAEIGGERLEFVSVDRERLPLFGYQHEIPDAEGRIWRTEAVLSTSEERSFLSLRVSCVRGLISASVATPRRPVLLKQLLEDAIGDKDLDLIVSDSPHFISEDELEKAKRVILGQSSRSLPVVYVSSKSANELPVDVARLAFELGGVAHVVVEPCRSFSFLLRDETDGRNPYGGAIGIGFPGAPVDIRVLPSRDTRSQFSSVLNLVRETFVGRTALMGAGWSELQQAAYQHTRSKLEEMGSSSAGNARIDEWIESFGGELREKDAEIGNLRSEIEGLRARLAAGISHSALSQKISELRGTVGELYEGEILDRLRNAVAYASNQGFSVGARDRAVMDALLPLMNASGFSGLLLDAIKAASDNDRTDAVFKAQLAPLGFSRREQGSHIKYSPPIGVVAIDSITIAKTPSDHRAGDNSVQAARRALGLHFASDR